MQRLLTVSLLLVLNSAYLAARAEPSVFYYSQVALHVALGLAAAALWLRALRAELRPSSRGDRALAVLAGAALLSGAALAVTGATRPFRALLYAHVALAVLATLAVACRAALAAVPLPDSPARNALLTGAVAALLSIPVAVGFAGQERREAARAGRIVNPPLPPASMDGEGDGPRSPFFPSSATTTTGQVIPATFFMTSESCARCHKDIYDQWNSSAHHFASFNNQLYRKSIEYMQDVVGTQPTKWCAGCHDHAVFFNGRFDRAHQGADRHARGPERPGLPVLPRHRAREQHHGPGRLQDRVPAAARPGGQREPLLQLGHDRFCDLDPEPHRKAFLKPFHREQSPSTAPPATRCTSTCRSTTTAGCAASTTTTTGRPAASRARARAPSTTPSSRRPAPTATCRWWPAEGPRGAATDACTRTASRPPTPRCRSPTGTRAAARRPRSS